MSSVAAVQVRSTEVPSAVAVRSPTALGGVVSGAVLPLPRAQCDATSVAVSAREYTAASSRSPANQPDVGADGHPLTVSPPSRQNPAYAWLVVTGLPATTAPSTYSCRPDSPCVTTAWCHAPSLYAAVDAATWVDPV